MEWSTRTFGSQGPAGTYQRPGRHSRSSSTSSTSSSRSPPRSPSSSPPSPPARRRRSRPKASDYFGLAPGATLEDPIDSLSGVLADLDPKRERPSSDDDEAASDPANRIPVSTGFSDASERGCEDSEESRETPVPYTSYRDYSADDADADDEEERAPKKKKKRARRTRTRKASKEEGSSSSGYAVESSQTTKKSYSPPSSPTPPSTPATPSSLSSSYYSTPGTDCSSRSSSPDSPPTPYTPVSQLGVGARGLFDDGLDDVMEDASQATGFQNKGGFSGQLFTGGSTPNFGAPKFSNPTNTSWTQHGGQNSGAVNFNRPSVANMGQGGFAQGTAPFNSFAPPQTYNHPPFFDSASQFTAPPPPHQQQRQQQQRPQSFGSFAPSPPHPPASNNTSMPTTSTGTSPFGRPTNSVFPAPPPNVAANFSASNPFNKTNQPQSNPFAGKPPQPTAQPQPQVNPFAGPSLVASQPAFAAAAPFPAAATPFPAVATPFPGTSSPFTGPASPFTGAGSRFNGAAPSGPASGSSFKPPAATEKKPVFPQAPAQNGSAPNPFFNGVKASNQPPSPPPSDTEEVVETRKVRFTDSDAVADRYNRELAIRAKRRAQLIKEGKISDPDNRGTLENAIVFEAKCMNMCPEFECLERKHQKYVDVYETDQDGNPVLDLFVKSFHRPAAGIPEPLPEDVRPPAVLVETLRYLLSEVLAKNTWKNVHGFLRDRTRSIRQDFQLQNYHGEASTMCIEIIARYHILNTHIMIGANGEYLELEQLDKSLTTLAEHYSDGLKPDADGNQKIFPNEDEFRAYTILRHPRDSYIERQDYTRNWPEHVRNSKKVQHAFNLREAMNDHAFPSPYGFEARQYFSTFFELVKSKDTDMFTLCLLQLHFGEIRKHALKMLTDTYMKTSRNTTVDFIKEYLCYESVDIAIDEMTSYGLSIKEYTSDDGQSYRYLEPLTGQLNSSKKEPGAYAHPTLFRPKLAVAQITELHPLMTLEKPLLEIIWGSNHHVSTYPAPIMPDENALLRGLHKFAEPATQFGGAISRFFNFNAAGAGEISDATASTWTANIPSNSGANAFANTTSPFAQNQGSEFQSAFGQTQRSVPPLASGAAPFNAPLKRPSVFATDNAFGTPAAPSELYIPKTTVFREANAAIKKAPLSFGSPNPFAKSAAPATLPTEASAENQRSLFDRITPPSQSLGAKPVDDKPLFLGGEDVVSDEEEETEEDNVIPTNPTAWTSLLPNKAGSASTNPGQGVDFSRPSSGQGIDFSKPLSSNGLQYSNVKSAAPNTTQFTAANTNGFTPTLPPQQNTPKFNFQGRLNTPAPAPSIEAQPAPGFHFAPLGAIPGQAIAGAEAAAKAAEAEEKLENERRQQEEAAARKLREEQEAAAKAEREREHEEAVLKEKLEREAAIAREEREREQILVEKAEKFRNRHLIEKFYYPYVEKAKKKRRRTERELRKRHRNEYSEDPQWWPIVKDGNLYKQSVEEVSQLVFKSAELRESVPDIIHLALEESNISRANYRMLLHNNDHTGKSHLWFGQKFLGGKNAITVPSSRGLGNEFHAQLNVTADEAVDVGFLVFGCSTDFSISNEDRFMQDSAQLHNIVDYLTQHTKMHKIAVMVICYRSPLDNEPANPMGLDGSRTLGKARKNRVEMVKKALNFDAFGDKVTGKKVVMVETLRDVDLTHELRTFADEFVFETVPRCLEVSPGGTTRRIVQPVSPQRPRSRKTVAPRTEVSPIGTKRKQPAKPTPKKEGKRKRIMPPTPRMPIQAQSSTRDQSTSSARRSKDAALIETPMKRYRHKEQEKELADAARLKTMSMIGFSMYLSSPAKHATLTPRRATPPKPKVEAPVSTKKVYNRISLLEAEMEDFKRMMDESSLPSTI